MKTYKMYVNNEFVGSAGTREIVNPATGLHVMGWNARDGVVDTSGAPQNLRIPIGEGVIGKV